MLILITEMLITQGVTNTPYKSPHPRHREEQKEGDTLAQTHKYIHLHIDYIHHHNQSSKGRLLSAFGGVWILVYDEWVDPDGVMTG